MLPKLGAQRGKPVGRVHLALAEQERCVDWELRLDGDRGAIRRGTVERALERLINYKQRLERSRFAAAHANSVEGKHAYSLRGAGDTAEVVTWRTGGEDVLIDTGRFI